MSDAITSTKLEQTGEIFLDNRGCLSTWVSAFLSPAHESEMRGYLVYVLIVKTIPPILFKFGDSVLDWTALSWNFFFFFFGGGDFCKNILRGVCGPYYL